MSLVPPSPQGLTQASSILSEVLRGLPVIAVMWYMLKDLKTVMGEVVKKVNKLEIEVASDSAHLKISYLETALKEVKAEYKAELDTLKKRDALVDSQLTKLWTKVGDRPEDARRRMKGQ